KKFQLLKILLLLLSALALSRGADDSIDLGQCGKTRDCFLRDSCIGTTNANVLMILEKGKTVTKENCDIIIQTRYYTRDRHRFIMQVNLTDSTEEISDSDIILNHDGDQFKCTKNGPEVNKALFEIGKPHRSWNSKLIVCAFTLKNKNSGNVS
ncbi:hypothetical protein PMAYCL1PPCAC_08835, partial [Pristionchus mayeri]